MLNKIIRIYQNLPDKRKKMIGDYLFPLKFLVKSILELRFDVYEVTGEKTIVYLTSGEPDPGFIECFYPGATITRVDKTYIWSLRKIAREHETVIFDMHHYLARFFTKGVITVPWVRLAFDVSVPRENLFKIKNGREIKKALKFQPEFTTEPADLQFFYERMYLPYIQKRYSNAYIHEFVFMQNDMKRNGELCFIKKGDQRIAGVLFNQIDDTYYLLSLGLIDDCYLKEGAIAAIYYYGIQRAFERNAKKIDFGLTRPFLSDGVLVYKRKWGGYVIRDHRSNHVLYLKNLTKNGLIILEDEKLKVMLFAGEDTFLSAGNPDTGLEIKVIEHQQDDGKV